MPTIQSKGVVATGVENAFDLAHLAARRKAWDPFIRDSRYPAGEPDPAVGAVEGTRIWTRARNGLTMTVEYEVVKRPTFVAMQMVDGPWFFSKFTGAWRFEPVDEASTRVTFRYGFVIRQAWLRPWMQPAVRWALQRDIDRRFAAYSAACAGNR